MKKITRESQEPKLPMQDSSKPSSTGWFVPLPRNRFFTGREAILHALHENFYLPDDKTEARVQVISGVGGIGKTQLVLEYAYRFRNDYTMVLWLRTETLETLLSDLIALIDFLDLPEKQAQEHQQILSAFKHWLDTHSNWLLIIDNVEDFDIVHELLPTRSVNHMFVTTRRQVGEVSQSRLNLQTWSSEEGALFLLHRAKLLPQQAPLESAVVELRIQAANISQQLGGLPLALDQAGAYIEETGCTLIGYQQRLEERLVLLLSRRGSESFAHPDPVTTTIHLAVERVEREFPAAAELLRLCAFLAPDAIPEKLFTKQRPETLGLALYSSTTNPFEIDTIYTTFKATSLVELNVHTRHLHIHRLVQAVLMTYMDKETQQQWARRALLAVNQAFPVTRSTMSAKALSWSDQLLPHALLTLTWIDRLLPAEQQSTIALEISELLFKASSYLVFRGYDYKAQPLLKRCLAMREQTLGPTDLAVAEPLALLGSIARTQGLHAEAEALLQRALTLYDQAASTTSSTLVQVLGNLAMLSLDRGQYQKAETFIKRVLSIQEQSADGVPSLTLSDLANIYRRQGRYEEARALLLHSIRLHEQVFGPEDSRLLILLNNLANFYTEQGKYAEAKPFYQRALRVSEQTPKSDASYVATVLFNLGEVYRQQEQYEEAESHYLRALSLWEQTMGPGHLRTTYVLHSLALLQMAQGQLKEAEQFLQETIQIREKAYDEEHSDLAEALHDLARLYTRQGKDETAESLFERALQIQEQVLGPMHPAIATSLYHLGQLYARQGRKEQARSLYERSLAMREQVLGKRHPDTQTTRNSLKMLDHAPEP